MRTVFISGATGYMGRPLTEALVRSGFDVRALARPQSLRKLPIGCRPIPGDALRASTFVDEIPVGSTIVHLTGVAHPSPSKAAAFRAIDRVSFEASLEAAMRTRAAHFVYVSVAHPAPVMREYIHVRQECERMLVESGLTATVLRPWYVLGPGHWWPYLLKPLYALASLKPEWKQSAERLGLVTHAQMLRALEYTVENPPALGINVLDVPAIRAAQPRSSLGMAIGSLEAPRPF